MAINLTIEQANELLTLLGAEVAVVENADEATKDVDLTGLVSEIKPEPSEPAPSVNEDEVRTKAIGRLMGIAYSSLAQTFGIKRSDLENLKMEEIAAKLKSIVDSRYSQTEGNLRAELEEANNKLNSLSDEKDQEWQAKIEELNGKFTEKNIVDSFAKTYNSIPKKGGDINELAETAYLRAKQKYNIVWNESKGEPEFFDKNNPEQRVMMGKNPLVITDYVSDFNKKIGNDAPDTSHVNPKDVTVNTPIGVRTANEPVQEDQPFNLSHLKQQAEEMTA